jgi:ectoine hydroxylase-related dioxygenase (phytanoyl-CoA dioxygenase family)
MAATAKQADLEARSNDYRRWVMLSEQQKKQFHTLGFLHLPGFIADEEMRTYVDAFDGTMAAANVGMPWDQAPQRQQVVPFYRENAAVYHRLLDNDDLFELVEDLIGEDFVFSVSEGVQHFGGTRWHHDAISPEGHIHLKVVFFVDPVRADSGCLRVIPGTQFKSFRDTLKQDGEEILAMGADTPGAYAIEADPGDAVVFIVKCYHGAFGDSPRRAIYLNFIQNPATPEQELYVTGLYESDASRGWAYYTPELFADATPKRMKMLAFLKERCFDAD